MINKVILLGRLGSDPETRFLPSGDPLATFSVATSRSWKDKSSGEKVEKTVVRGVYVSNIEEIKMNGKRYILKK